MYVLLHTLCQFFLLAIQRLPFLLLIDIGYSVVLFYILVYVLTVCWLLFSFEMCITPSPAHTQRMYSPELLRKLNSDQSSKIQRDVRKKTVSATYLESPA